MKPTLPLAVAISGCLLTTSVAGHAGESPISTAASGPSTAAAAQKPPRLLMRRVWEPNERAFSVLLPEGWKLTGGIFNVNPLQMNGPGNTVSPKLDLTIRQDEAGTVMLHWLPAWNHADLTFSPMGFSLFPVGSFYQGMPVKPMVTARQFLTDLLTARPGVTELKVLAEDPLPEITKAYAGRAEVLNRSLAEMGLRPLTFEALALGVEYTEGGRRFRECLSTTIADFRGGAYLWSNDDTLLFRAPVESFETWKPVFDTIRLSREPNPQWVEAVTRASGERAQKALETQRYINRVSSEIVENRRRTHAKIRHEDWLLLSGNEEYTNPFTGRTELDTSRYHHRWTNNQGDVLYVDEDSFDPNEVEEYKTREWKRTPVRPR